MAGVEAKPIEDFIRRTTGRSGCLRSYMPRYLSRFHEYRYDKDSMPEAPRFDWFAEMGRNTKRIAWEEYDSNNKFWLIEHHSILLGRGGCRPLLCHRRLARRRHLCAGTYEHVLKRAPICKTEPCVW